MHDTSDLGPAMGLAHASDTAKREALAETAKAAASVCASLRKGAAEMVRGGPDQAAVLNAALGWERFAKLLGWRELVTHAAQARPSEPVESAGETYLGSGILGGLSGPGIDMTASMTAGGAGGGGDFGGGGASGTW